jgi:hypothetical protein
MSPSGNEGIHETEAIWHFLRRRCKRRSKQLFLVGLFLPLAIIQLMIYQKIAAVSYDEFWKQDLSCTSLVTYTKASRSFNYRHHRR